MKNGGRIRIVAGQAGGLYIQTPKKFTSRPTQERVREALFSSIGEKISDSRFIDLYAGTGAVGIEALSRGAGSVTFVESDRNAIATIRANLKHCHLEGEVHPGRVEQVLSSIPDESADIIFSDPPYDQNLKCLDAHPVAVHLPRILAPEGLIIWEHDRQSHWDSPEGLEVLRVKKHGETRLTFLCRR